MTTLADYDAERAVIGAVLLAPRNLQVALEAGVRPDHFYWQKHTFKAMVELSDADRAVDPVTIRDHLHRNGIRVTATEVDGLAADAPAAGNVGEYARIVVDLAHWRRRDDASHQLRDAIGSRDDSTFQVALHQLGDVGITTEGTYTPGQMADLLFATLEKGAHPAWTLPFPKLTELLNGGIRRGQVTIIGGWSSHGKSATLDQLLEHVADQGAKTHLYINEMTPLERGLRTVARDAGVSVAALLGDDLDQDERQRVVRALPNQPFGITDCAGWSAPDIARHARRLRPDVIGIDHMHLIDYSDERDLARISREINVLSKRADCHVFCAVQLNENRVTLAERPPPTLGDIRGSGAIKNDANHVLFVHREQDDLGRPGTTSHIYLSKNRGGPLGGFPATFLGRTMQFIPA